MSTNLPVIIRRDFEIILPDEFFQLRDSIIAGASLVTRVSSDRDNERAAKACQELKGLLRRIERDRKAVKEPIISLGRKIEEVASEASQALQAELSRIDTLQVEYRAEIQERARQIQLVQEREAAALRAVEAQKQREVEEAQRGIADANSLAEAKAAAELSRKAAEAAQVASQAARAVEQTPFPVPTPPQAKGQTWVDSWDYEILDLHTLYLHSSRFVRLEDRRAEIRAWINSDSCTKDKDGVPVLPGLRMKRISVQRTASKREGRLLDV